MSHALLKVTQIIEELFSLPAAEEKYASIKALKKIGPDEVEAFRKYILKEDMGIVQSDNPVLALRKALIDNIQLDRQSRLLLANEFRSRRQTIYDELNKSIENPHLRWSDSLLSTIAIWSEVEGVCLRQLQTSMVEKGSEGDWWSKYMLKYEEYVGNLYRSYLAKADGQQSSVYSALAKGSHKSVEDLEMKLTGKSQ